MADIVDAATRSRMMRGIRSRDTKPEILLRRMLHAAGLRFRLHAANVPGKPDIVFPSRKAAIFVHGCFWHRHSGCRWSSTPSSNVDFWLAKFRRNVERDAEVRAQLHLAGWRIATVWECSLNEATRADVAESVVDWVRNGSGNFETPIVRVPDEITPIQTK